MNLRPWKKRAREAEEQAERDRAQLEEVRARWPDVRAAERRLAHFREINNHTRRIRIAMGVEDR